MWPWAEVYTSLPSGILIHPTVWPQYTNVTEDRTDRQRSDSIRLKQPLQLHASSAHWLTTGLRRDMATATGRSVVGTSRLLQPSSIVSLKLKSIFGEATVGVSRHLDPQTGFMRRPVQSVNAIYGLPMEQGRPLYFHLVVLLLFFLA